MNGATRVALGRMIAPTFAVVYPTASRLLDCLNELVISPNPYRPQGALIVSDPNNGKTVTLRMLQRDITALPPPPDSPNYIPSIFIQAPVGASRRDLYQSIAEAVRIPLADRMSGDRLRAQSVRAIRERGIRAILVDEFHNLIAGPEARRRIILDDFKTISNAAGIPFFCAGTEKAYFAIETDDQYLSRLRPLNLPKWEMNRDYLSLLKCLEKEMGAAPGTFINPETSRALWQLSKGLIGRTVEIMNGSLREATLEGAPAILRSHIERSGFSDLPWIQPSGSAIG